MTNIFFLYAETIYFPIQILLWICAIIIIVCIGIGIPIIIITETMENNKQDNDRKIKKLNNKK